jgi:hypothetical protein
MKYHFAAVPAVGGEAAAAELNRLLGARWVTRVEHMDATANAGRARPGRVPDFRSPR